MHTVIIFESKSVSTAWNWTYWTHRYISFKRNARLDNCLWLFVVFYLSSFPLLLPTSSWCNDRVNPFLSFNSPRSLRMRLASAMVCMLVGPFWGARRSWRSFVKGSSMWSAWPCSCSEIHTSFCRNTQSWQYWHFCTTSNGNKLEMITSWIHFNANLRLLQCFEIKIIWLITTFNFFRNANIANFDWDAKLGIDGIISVLILIR